MARREADEKQDRALEDSFPASDPPSGNGVTGPRVARRRQPPHTRDAESRPKGTPTHERHATETAYQWEHEGEPPKQ
jgi:hypothetical protein